MVNKTDTIYSKIDVHIKERAMQYVTSSKITKRVESSTFKALIEDALDEYMIKHPILETHETQETQD